VGIYKKHILPVQTGILVGLMVTSLLFIGLPLLTQVQRPHSKTEDYTRILISNSKPPPPPEPEREKEEPEKPKERELKKSTPEKITAVPKIEMPSFNMPGANISGSISIGLIEKTDFYIDASLMTTAFELTEVDQQPKIMRYIDPQYPFLARRKNIEGVVFLKIVIDKDGYVQEPEIYSVDPEGEGFEEEALKVVVKYKYQPAIVDGEPVDCIGIQQITFNLR
jgi:protein TonB